MKIKEQTCFRCETIYRNEKLEFSHEVSEMQNFNEFLRSVIIIIFTSASNNTYNK